jgi:hypothetical protein
MTYEEKSEIVIRQLREDRDRLLDVLDKIRAEIEQEISNASSVDYVNGLNVALMIINEKYR